MDKKELLFYDAYEAFYAMARESKAFRAFCADAFGEDFSQDGFSNVEQIDLILPFIPRAGSVHILDVGCGNGKMLGYLQRKTGADIHGFDYSSEAIKTARTLFPGHSDFREGVIGEIDYPAESFDIVISMDTMYFAPDMNVFTAQVKRWLKPGGVFFVGYQEGDVIPKTKNIQTTLLTKALAINDLDFHAEDITEQTYRLLKTKRQAALRRRKEFEAEGNSTWFDMLMGQTACVEQPLDQFRETMARYIYVIRKRT